MTGKAVSMSMPLMREPVTSNRVRLRVSSFGCSAAAGVCAKAAVVVVNDTLVPKRRAKAFLRFPTELRFIVVVWLVVGLSLVNNPTSQEAQNKNLESLDVG